MQNHTDTHQYTQVQQETQLDRTMKVGTFSCFSFFTATPPPKKKNQMADPHLEVGSMGSVVHVQPQYF